MTEESKKLFDAPWRATDLDYVEDANGFYVCECGTHLTASNIARLPELYDALIVAAYEHCRVCLYGHVKDARHMPKPDDMARNGCTLSDFPHCPNRNWWNLLKKVRDGE